MRKFNHDWFSPNIPILEQQLSRFRGQPTRMLEIGSYEGMSTCWFLDNLLTHPASSLVCVETFEGSAEHKELGISFAETEQIFRANTAGSGLKLMKLESLEALAKLLAADRRFDLVYIDGSHLAADVLTDAAMVWPMVVSGGVVVFDDYGWDRYPEPWKNPRLAIDSFMACFTGQYKLLHCGYQVILERV